jgi:tetratricopeptide (TPR) repeat protein
VAFWYGRTWRSAPDEAKAIAFATAWMLLTLLPVLNFRFLPEGEIAYDRYLYLPSVGFVILAALALRAAICMAASRIARRALGAWQFNGEDKASEKHSGVVIRSPFASLRVNGAEGSDSSRESGNASNHNDPSLEARAQNDSFPPHWPAWTAGFVLFSAMGYATARQTLFWSDDLTLNYRAHEIAPRNVNATASLAAAVAQRGMDATAMALYREALAAQPGFWRANVNLAYLYYAHGNYPEAARLFARAGAADPTDGDQFLYLGMSLLRMGRLTEAAQAVRTALIVRPQGKSYHLGLAIVLRGEGRLPEARGQVEAELAADPQNLQAKTLLRELAP